MISQYNVVFIYVLFCYIMCYMLNVKNESHVGFKAQRIFMSCFVYLLCIHRGR